MTRVSQQLGTLKPSQNSSTQLINSSIIDVLDTYVLDTIIVSNTQVHYGVNMSLIENEHEDFNKCTVDT